MDQIEPFFNKDEDRDDPIVRSKPVPTPFAWNDNAMLVKLYTLYLTSFGHAQFAHNQVIDKVTVPYPYRAPELVLRSANTQIDGKVDMWAIGCMVFELLTGRACFTVESGEEWNEEEDYLAKVVQFTGDTFSDAFGANSEVLGKYLSESGSFIPFFNLLFLIFENRRTQASCDTPPRTDDRRSAEGSECRESGDRVHRFVHTYLYAFGPCDATKCECDGPR